MYIRPLAISGELRKVPKVHILPSWLCRCPEARHQQQIVCSLTPCRFATTAIGSRSPRRRIARTCSSVNFDLRMLVWNTAGCVSANFCRDFTLRTCRLPLVGWAAVRPTTLPLLTSTETSTLPALWSLCLPFFLMLSPRSPRPFWCFFCFFA